MDEIGRQFALKAVAIGAGPGYREQG